LLARLFLFVFGTHGYSIGRIVIPGTLPILGKSVRCVSFVLFGLKLGIRP